MSKYVCEIGDKQHPFGMIAIGGLRQACLRCQKENDIFFPSQGNGARQSCKSQSYTPA